MSMEKEEKLASYSFPLPKGFDLKALKQFHPPQFKIMGLDENFNELITYKTIDPDTLPPEVKGNIKRMVEKGLYPLSASMNGVNCYSYEVNNEGLIICTKEPSAETKSFFDNLIK